MADLTNEGIDAGNAFTAAARKSAAYDALNKAYGPAVADNPENALAAAQASAAMPLAPQNAQTAAQQGQANVANVQAEVPLKQAQTSQANVTAQTGQGDLDTRAAIRGARMLQAVKNPDGSIPSDSAQHILSNPAFGIDPAHITPFVNMLAQPNGADHLDGVIQALQAGGKVTGGAQMVTDASGVNHLILHTATGGIQDTNIGSEQTAAQKNASYAGYKATTGRIAATQPKGLIVTPTGDVTAVGGGAARPTGVQSVAGPAGTEAKAASTVVGKAEGTNKANELPQNVNIARADLGQMDLQYGRTFNALDKASKLVSPFSTGIGGRTVGELPGSQRSALEAQVQTAKSNIALLTANLSRQGAKSTAIPVRNMQEFKAYQDALGAIDTRAAPSVVRDQIATAHRSLQALQGGVHSMYQAKYGQDLGVQPPAGPVSPTGFSNLRVSQ